MPNLPVDVNSWGRSACYPRSTFYPLSDGASTRYRQITKTYFRTCSRCLSRSQAPLCLYTLRLVSNQPERTFARLRYFFGGDRPSQTTHQTLSPARVNWLGLEFKDIKGGISRLAPPKLASRIHRLPPILHIIALNSMSAIVRCRSSATAGKRIFTVLQFHWTPVRQWGNRTHSCSRNLPDRNSLP